MGFSGFSVPFSEFFPVSSSLFPGLCPPFAGFRPVNSTPVRVSVTDFHLPAGEEGVFITLGKGISYFISLVYTEHGLALGTAFVPDGEWLRKMKVQSTLLGP